jgi:hypothetical protein
MFLQAFICGAGRYAAEHWVGSSPSLRYAVNADYVKAIDPSALLQQTRPVGESCLLLPSKAFSAALPTWAPQRDMFLPYAVRIAYDWER